ncbi:hypothetical protein [Pseudomonas gingeri]|uniref:HNH endonuclease 5 domain-containing protein n=1 Tax=Pseudomonas gingeri TaxID=117681 RepID=A0A7Y7YDN7_9PSED|nr:hypothetical protein [Pseudomonas gingeri]NWB25803.1 hypothetical protein [Pseudomonas gingeri]NWC34577.1 hypothetical protein [Pseudomonas gingeri]
METTGPECIYCKSYGPFDIEHVFPKGMGGDDQDFLLKDIVCEKCNNRFSALEGSLMRSSPLGLSRLINQTVSKGNEKSPQFNTTTNFVHDEESNSLLEAVYESGMKVTLLPQIIFKEKHLRFHAENSNELVNFISKLNTFFDHENLEIAFKKADQKCKIFVVDTYEWIDNTYHKTSSRLESKPPKKVIWFELHLTKGEQPNATPFEPRIYKRKQGQISLKVCSESDLSLYLRATRLNFNEGLNTEKASIREIKHPLILTEFTTNISEGDRAFAKMGINLIAHISGKEHAQDPAFDSIKSSILSGSPLLPMTMRAKNSDWASDKMLGTPPEGHHALMLSPAVLSDGTIGISFVAKIYGTDFGIALCQNAKKETLKEPYFILVNYNKHKIKVFKMNDYIKYSGAHNDTMIKAYIERYPIKLSKDFFK